MIKESLKIWRINNPDRLKAIDKKWREKNKNKLLEYNREYYKKNKEGLDKYNREWIAKHPEYRITRREYHNKWYQENIDRRRATIRAYDRSVSEQRHEKGKSTYGRYLVVSRRHRDRWTTPCISLEDFSEITSQPCEYCGEKTVGGLDRVNNFLGYEKSNVVSCCKVCNYMKNKLPFEEFKIHIKKVYENLYSNSKQ